MGDVDNLLPDIVGVLDFGTPLPEIVSFAVRYQAICRNQAEAVCRIVSASVSQKIFSFPVHFETFPLSVFVQDIFGTIVDRILEHLGGSRIECRVYPSPFADCRFHFGDGCQAFVQCFGPDKADVIYDCAGNNVTMGQAIANARKGSTIILVAVFATRGDIDLAVLNDHELDLNTSMMYRNEDYLAAIELVNQGKVLLKPLISKHFAFQDYLKAYQYIDENRETTMKVIINVQE